MVLGVGRGAARQEELHRCPVFASDGTVQWGLQGDIGLRHQICSVVEQGLLDGCVALGSCKVQRRLAIVGLDGRVGAPFEEGFDHG